MTLMRDFKAAYETHVEAAQEKISNATTAFLDVARENFDLVRSDNAMRESELDPQFRDRLEEAVRASREELTRVQSSFS